MNPLAAYMVAAMKAEKTCETRRYIEFSRALEEMGYWLLSRPAGCEMPQSSIRDECQLVDEFTTTYPACHGCHEFEAIISVYADPKMVPVWPLFAH